MAKLSHGRIYVRGLPPEWTWFDAKWWVTKELHLPEPSFVYMHPRRPGTDVVSCYIHWYRPTMGQLTTFAEHLDGVWLTHRATQAQVSQDEFTPRLTTRFHPYGQAPWLKPQVFAQGGHVGFPPWVVQRPTKETGMVP